MSQPDRLRLVKSEYNIEQSDIDEERPIFVFTAQIYELENERWTLSGPVSVVVEDWKDEYVARIPDLLLYGSSHIEEKALRELKERLVVMREDERDPETLGEPLRSQMRAIHRLVVARQ